METTEVKGGIPITEPKPADAGVGTAQTLTTEDVEKIIEEARKSERQRIDDRVRTELYGKIKVKESEIEELKKSKMSESEIRKYKEEQLSQREQELKQKELVIIATDSLRESNLPIELRDFVIAEDEPQTKARVLVLKETFQKAVEAAVSEKFKASGHEPGKGEPAKGRRIYTRSEIAKMSKEEYAKNSADLQLAIGEGRIKPG